MLELAAHLVRRAKVFRGAEAKHWSLIEATFDENEGLKAALLKHAPTDALEVWIVRETTELLGSLHLDLPDACFWTRFPIAARHRL